MVMDLAAGLLSWDKGHDVLVGIDTLLPPRTWRKVAVTIKMHRGVVWKRRLCSSSGTIRPLQRHLKYQ